MAAIYSSSFATQAAVEISFEQIIRCGFKPSGELEACQNRVVVAS